MTFRSALFLCAFVVGGCSSDVVGGGGESDPAQDGTGGGGDGDGDGDVSSGSGAGVVGGGSGVGGGDCPSAGASWSVCWRDEEAYVVDIAAVPTGGTVVLRGWAETFVTRLDANGAVAWESPLGSDQSVALGSVGAAVDGKIVVGGSCNTNDCFGHAVSGGSGFVAGFDADGGATWTAALDRDTPVCTEGGACGVVYEVSAVAVDDAGATFVAARLAALDEDDEAPRGAVFKLSADGEILWSAPTVEGLGLGVDRAGDVIVVPWRGDLDNAVKLAGADGARLWEIPLVVSEEEEGGPLTYFGRVAFDSDDNPVFVGDDMRDGLVVAVDSSTGEPRWTTRITAPDGARVPQPWDVARRGDELIVVGTFSNDLSAGEVELAGLGGPGEGEGVPPMDIYGLRIDAAGAVVNGVVFGSTADETARGVAVDAAGSVIVIGDDRLDDVSVLAALEL